MSEPIITARGLSKHFGPVMALRPLDLSVAAGTTLAVLGPNGAGKSTLLRLLAGLARPSAGTLTLGAGSGDRRERRRSVGLVAHQSFLYDTLTARENLVLAARLFGVPEPGERADALLAELGLAAVADRRAGAFSRGMGQRLAIARALVHDPPLLLLDEPFAGLDPPAVDRLTGRLAELPGRGHTVVLVTHDLPRAASLADAALVLARGRAFPVAAEAAGNPAGLEGAYRDAVERTGGGEPAA